MAVSQSLSVTEVAGSANVAANSSKVRILWTSTQTYESWNGYTRTAYYWVSVNGGAETKYSVSYTLDKGTTNTILDVTITVNHKDDGSGTVKVRTWMDTDISAGIVEKSQTITLATIARASTMDSLSCSTKYFDGAMTYKYTPKSASYYNRCNITLNLNGSHVSVKTINIGTKSASRQTGTVTLSSSELSTVYNKIPNGNSGVLRFTLLTYSDSGYSNQVGDAVNKEITLYIPENSSTKPELVISLEPVGSLPAAFSGLYVQGKTKVKAIVVSAGKYGATIKSTTMSVEGKSYGPDESYTSDYLPSYGDVTVTTVAKDSRGFSTTLTSKIPVIAYTKPKITVDICGRCDANGNLNDGGTSLKIKATRSYNPMKSGNNQKNFCKIQYRFKLTTASSYSAWTTILAEDSLNSDTVETDALLDGVLAVNASYHVQVQAVDDIGESAESTINIPTEEIYMHRTKNAMGLGKYAEGENLLDVGWDAHFHGEVRIGPEGKTLKEYILSVISEGG